MPSKTDHRRFLERQTDRLGLMEITQQVTSTSNLFTRINLPPKDPVSIYDSLNNTTWKAVI